MIRPEVVLGIWQDRDGWLSAWSEPVTMLAVVERRYYSLPHPDVPEAKRKRYLREFETIIEPVIYDPNSLSGYSTLSDLNGESRDEIVSVEPAASSWEDLMRRADVVQGIIRYREETRRKRLGLAGSAS
jgi:hypothetical protein